MSSVKSTVFVGELKMVTKMGSLIYIKMSKTNVKGLRGIPRNFRRNVGFRDFLYTDDLSTSILLRSSPPLQTGSVDILVPLADNAPCSLVSGGCVAAVKPSRAMHSPPPPTPCTAGPNRQAAANYRLWNDGGGGRTT